ncbi:hypothetical protein Csa_016392 [Cucumis sativus]|uniref:Uncharacterized protein n=1 Tax=Cucumis sativus TaxID=3659 RepID=A0A0A0K776_CUCSA|nr:hypothetical protein Csa_016392 [Cucumis sativus]
MKKKLINGIQRFHKGDDEMKKHFHPRDFQRNIITNIQMKPTSEGMANDDQTRDETTKASSHCLDERLRDWNVRAKRQLRRGF